MKRFTKQIVLITGASSGIGQACAELFANEGAKLILAARRVERLQALQKSLQTQYHTDCYLLPLDVRSKEQVQTQIQSLPPDWQSIDVLINNAGLALGSLPLAQGNTDNWDTVIDTNIKGLLYVTKEILPGMLERNKGHIINMGSIAGHECYPNGSVYIATKHAVHALSKSLRMDVLGSAVRVTEIAPGAVETEFSIVRWKDEEKAREFYKDFQPLNAKDVADTVLYCVSRPKHVNIEQMIIMPTAQASVNHLFRGGRDQ